MALFYYRFRVFGLKPKSALIFRYLVLYAPKDSSATCVIETTHRSKSIEKVEKDVFRFIELLRIFYLKWINYYAIEKKENENEEWKWFKRISAANILTDRLLPFYDEKYINKFLELTFSKTKQLQRTGLTNNLLITARTRTLAFETSFLLRWMALESLISAENISKKNLAKKQYNQLQKEWNKFASRIKSTKIKSIIDRQIRDTLSDLTFREKFAIFTKQKKLPISYEDIKDSKRIRDHIVHTGSISGLECSISDAHKCSMILEALVRNILMHYLGLKFDPNWRIWYAWTCWKPQKRR